MDYFEFDFTVKPVQPASEILITRLADAGFDSFVETDKGFTAYAPVDAFILSEFNEVVDSLQEVSIVFEKKLIPSQNWNNEWEKNFSPIDVNGVCLVRAPFHPKQANFEYEIVIEPKMSFGTGHHETTWLMLSEILSMDVKEKAILDMGCGTGVLGILALKKGALSCKMIDIDDWAVENTIENLVTNNVKADVYKGDAKILDDSLFHVILANINKNVLKADLQHYAKRLVEGGHLLLSGFFVSDCNELITIAQLLGLKLINQLDKNNWAMLHFEKK